jgi:hypothetical protein
MKWWPSGAMLVFKFLTSSALQYGRNMTSKLLLVVIYICAFKIELFYILGFSLVS